ncbi:hypothetical protein CH274_15580 [Rhodococcus sp. 06-418-5]|uniref:hypothetical protein n=1 Tax=Rhodococcus sp. 06-418-5 TaxID=2022507 RepID=UPI000B9A1EF0|nr:hypothetical protein [Rhodococcus sp. 06-418-5]OZC80589.1 hypothetical protein CH274_15580 [Rhodococcus sp. 06-418-5]
MTSALCEFAALAIVKPECAAHVLHHFNPTEGHAPGSFFDHIVHAFAVADPVNSHRLTRAFPDYSMAVHLAQDHKLGMDTLRAIALKEHA